MRFTIAESGYDTGGLKREWFNLVTTEIFNTSAGLFRFMQFNIHAYVHTVHTYIQYACLHSRLVTSGSLPSKLR